MRFLLVLACAAFAAVFSLRASHGSRPHAVTTNKSPQPIGITAALLMDARFTDARKADADNLPVPLGGRGPRVAVGNADDARKIGAHFFVPTQTMWRTTPLSFDAPEKEIAPRDLWERRAKFQIIDVREEEEFAASHIPTSSRRSMFEDFSREPKPVALFCLTGHRSAALVQKLRTRGVKNILSVRSGWLDWKHQRLPLSTVENHRPVEGS